MIWPNGSGKSNLLDIIHVLWKYGITINYEINGWDPSTAVGMTQLSITENNNTEHNLSKHRASPNQPSHIYLSLLLSQHDTDNLCFVNKYSHILNNIIENYSDLSFRFKTINEQLLIDQKKIPLYFTIDTNNHEIILRRHNLEPVLEIIYDYLQHFELIQLCMTIYNSHIRSQWERERYPLRNTFAIISPHSRTGQGDTQKNQLPKPLRLFLKKYHNLTNIDTQSNTSLLWSFFIEAINTTMKKYVKLTMKVNNNEWDVSTSLRFDQHDAVNKQKSDEITFVDTEWYILHYDELSSGEQSFVSIILLIYSHDLNNGLIIIDEPEIHLHPQSQELFIELLEEMKSKQNMQCIIATHAPSMINEHNINHVFRCGKRHNQTYVTCPENRIGEDDATLLQMLKFDNIAKIFFVDTIILVEGETDMYFINHYLNHLKTKPERSQILTNFEIVTIGGKGWFKRRKHFLHKFNIHAHYIGDRDNIIEYGIVSSINRHIHWHHRNDTHGKQFSHHIEAKGSKYANTIANMKEFQAGKYHDIVEGIQKLYADHVYLLKEWDLEAYLWLPAKGLDDTVHFCQYNFEPWLRNILYDHKRDELNHIVEMIFRKDDIVSI